MAERSRGFRSEIAAAVAGPFANFPVPPFPLQHHLSTFSILAAESQMELLTPAAKVAAAAAAEVQ